MRTCGRGAIISYTASRPQVSVFGQPFVIASDAQHRALRFRVGQRFRNTARFFSAPAPMLGIVDDKGIPSGLLDGMGTARTAKTLPIVMPTPKELRKNAEDRLRLARETDEMYVKMALIELAAEFRVMAEHLEPEALRLQASAVLGLRAGKTKK
jgi:hypothetical protein